MTEPANNEMQPAGEDLLATVRRERAEQIDAQPDSLAAQGYAVEWGKPAPEGCTPVKITSPDGRVIGATVCLDRRGRRRCEFCGGWSVAQCDYPTGGPCTKCKGAKRTKGGRGCHACAGTGYAMCNRRVCDRCRAHKDPDEDYCPAHRVAAGFPPLVRREQCHWTTAAANLARRDCLHRGCAHMVEPGERALLFPKRRRAMCEPCGEKYLEVAK